MEKEVHYESSKKYYVYGNEQSKRLLIPFHGFGQLAKYFSRHFESCFDTHKVLIPQAPSKAYLGNSFQKVGGCWLTKEDRLAEKQNNLSYLDAIWELEKEDYNEITLLGFSQGVSMVTRWASHQQIEFHQMILWAGGFPKELTTEHFSYLSPKAKIVSVLGDEDIYYTPEIFESERSKLEHCFPHQEKEFVNFQGGHAVDAETFQKIITSKK